MSAGGGSVRLRDFGRSGVFVVCMDLKILGVWGVAADKDVSIFGDVATRGPFWSCSQVLRGLRASRGAMKPGQI